jgi:hypothetical protein
MQRLTAQKRTRFSRVDLSYFAVLVMATVYCAFTQPVGFCIFACATIVYWGLWQVSRVIPIVEKYIGCRVRFWHVATAILTTTILGAALAPAQAFFLSGLEAFFINLAEQSTGAGGTAAVQPETITLIFNMIRGIFLLLVAAAGLFAYNQAQQQNDWRPIVVQIGLAFAIVLAVDVITMLFIGDGTGTGGGVGG